MSSILKRLTRFQVASFSRRHYSTIVRPHTLSLQVSPLKRSIQCCSQANSVLENSQPCLYRFLSTSVPNHDHLRPYVSKPYSYAFGRSKNEIMHKTIGKLLDERVAMETGKPMVISHHEGIRKTFSEFNEDVNRIAKAMHEDLGLKRGDVAGLWSSNTYNWISIQYACARLGVVLCTINPFYRAQELDYVLRKGDVKALFLPGKNSRQNVINNFAKTFQQALDIDDKTCHEPLLLKHVISIDGESYSESDIPSIRHIKSHTLTNLKERAPDLDQSITNQVMPDDPAIIMFTSGTTGKPKGAYLSQFTITNNSLLTAKSMSSVSSENMSMCVPLPFFHSFAGILGNVAMTATPFQLVMPCLKYDVAQIVDSMNANKVTHILVTPTLTIDMLNYIQKNKIKIPSLKSVLAGGASMPVEIAHQFVEAVPNCTDFRIGYGATETGPCATACRSVDTFVQRTETVGTPLDFVEIKLVNPETKTIVKLGECGEIHSRGHNTMLGYWKDPEKTRESIDRAGWYNTGDLGVMDEEGFLKIIGRTKELIIVGGENVYPREIEEVLHTHPSVTDVHVIGVPDPRKGEEICAWILLNNTAPAVSEEDMRKFCREKLAYFKVPRYILFVDSFPITSTGKAQKFIMREITCKKLNLKESR